MYTKYLQNIVSDFIDNGINGDDEIGKRFRTYNITRLKDLSRIIFNNLLMA